ncbi:MAG: response regulator [Bacteroidales bacterium]|nr:response regulator [Bacteroidales bacterium]MCF8333008.1 response regulator [Bacteroidales bacterium]
MTDSTQYSEKIAKLEEEIRELKEEQKNIQGQNISFHDFLALLTHKILTPMNSIIGLSNFLKEMNLNAEEQQLIDRIQSNGLSLVNIYNEILDFIQLEKPGDQEAEQFDLEQVVQNAIENFYENSISTKNVEISTHYQSGINKFYKGNKARLEQILFLSMGDPQNTEDKKKITIQVNEDVLDRSDDAIKFIITHNPSTLENQHIQYLTSEENKNWEKAIDTNNSFFKLLFVKKIVNIMKGTFTIQKGENHTHFHIMVPIDVVPTAENSGFSSSIPEFLGMQALIVSENISYQQELSQTLQHWGIKCFIAESEKDAIEKTIRETNLNFGIISDHLPDLTAKSLARKIKSLPGKSEFPLLLLQTKKSFLFSSDMFIDNVQSIENKTHLFEKILKNITEEKIRKEPHKLDTKLATKLPLDILVVEDDASNLELLLMLLKKLGYKADTAIDGHKAIASVKEKTYDIILLDIQIPKKSGFQVAKEVMKKMEKAEDKDKNKIIAISANTLQSTIDKATNAGMVDFITKPISFKKIEESLIKWGYAHKLLSLENQNT